MKLIRQDCDYGYLKYIFINNKVKSYVKNNTIENVISKTKKKNKEELN